MESKQSRRNFIVNSAISAASLGLLGSTHEYAAAAARTDMQEGAEPAVMKVGFCERDITPEIGMEQPGGYSKVFHKSVHDPCKVRAVVMDDGLKCVAMVGLDALGIYAKPVKAIREQVNKRCGIPSEAVLIGASHSHSSGPITGAQPGEYDHASAFVQELAYKQSASADPAYLEHVVQQVVDAVCEAYNTRIDASLGVGCGHEDKVAFNRRFRMKNGLTYTHPGQLNPDIVEPAGPIDPEVGVIGAWDKTGKCVGCIVNYACHATTNPGGISANWIYYMEQTIQGAMGSDCKVVFLQGASGDVTQVNNLNPYVQPRGEDWARFVGGRVGGEVVRVLLDMPRGVLVPLDTRIKVMEINRRVPSAERMRKSMELAKKSPKEAGMTNWLFAKGLVMLDAKLQNGKTAEVEVQAIQVGPAIFITNPAELFCQFGLDIKDQSPFRYTFPVELANGCVGYVPTEEAFGPHGGGYETRLTSYSNLEVSAGRKMVNTGVELAWQMKPGAMPLHPKAPPFKGKPWEYGSVKPELQ